MVQHASGKRIEAGMYDGLPHWRSDLRASLSAAARGQAAHQEQSRTLLPGARLRRNRQRRDAGFVSVESSLRETRTTGTWARIRSRPDAALAATFLPVFRIACRAVWGSSAGDPQKLKGA